MKKSVLFVLFFIVLLVIGVSAFSFNSDLFTKKGELRVTNEHPFLINGSWVKASELKVGDELFTVNGKKARIISIKDVNVSEGVDVYNLEVKGYENFIVDGIVVHNSNKPSFSSVPKRDVESVMRVPDTPEGLGQRLDYAREVLGKNYVDGPSKVNGKTNGDIILEAHKNLDLHRKYAILEEGLSNYENVETKYVSRELFDRGIAGELIPEYRHLAHNTANFEKLLENYRSLDPYMHESYQPKIVFYHATPNAVASDFSKGLDASKSTGGFFFCKSPQEAIDALQQMGFSPSELNVIKIEVSKNVYNPTGKKPIIRTAATTESDAFFVPVNRFDKFNELMKKGLITISR